MQPEAIARGYREICMSSNLPITSLIWVRRAATAADMLLPKIHRIWDKYANYCSLPIFVVENNNELYCHFLIENNIILKGLNKKKKVK